MVCGILEIDFRNQQGILRYKKSPNLRHVIKIALYHSVILDHIQSVDTHDTDLSAVMYIDLHYLATRGRGPGALVKAACLDSRRSLVRASLWPSSFKEPKCFPPHLRRLMLWGASVAER